MKHEEMYCRPRQGFRLLFFFKLLESEIPEERKEKASRTDSNANRWIQQVEANWSKMNGPSGLSIMILNTFLFLFSDIIIFVRIYYS